MRALTDQTCLIVCGNLEGKHLAVRRDLGQLGLDADFHALRRSGNVAYVYQRADRGPALLELTACSSVLDGCDHHRSGKHGYQTAADIACQLILGYGKLLLALNTNLHWNLSFFL